MSQGNGFEVSVNNDAGDVAKIHTAPEAQARALVEAAAAQLYPSSAVPANQYDLVVNGQNYSYADWNGKPVEDLGISVGATVDLLGPSEKGA